MRDLVRYLHDKIKPYPVSPSGFIPAYYFNKIIGKSRKNILIIGDYSKRDYDILNHFGHEIHILDIIRLEDVKNFTKQSITKKTKFNDETFDAIIISEVLEHLIEDYKALKEIRRILKNNGKLLLSVPFLDDEPEYHVRVHTKKTIIRLLEYSGFDIRQSFERGIVSWISNIPIIQLVAYSPLLLLNQDKYIKLYYHIEYFIGTYLRWFQMLFSTRGIILYCEKQDNKNFDEIQIKTFRSMVKK